MSSNAPLMALTESAQKGRPIKAPRAKRPPPPRRRVEKKQTLAFDEDARREFLTGFSKRKQERKQAARELVQKKIREEIKASRKAAAEARKQQAAENVRAERRAYGLDDEEADDDDNEEPLQEERDFETEERRAHVTIQEMDLDDWQTDVLPPSSRRASKKVAPAPAPAPPKSKPQRPAGKKTLPSVPSGSLTGILEPDVAQAAQSSRIFDDVEAPPVSKAQKPFTYLSKAEREKEREKQRQRSRALAEKRRAENKIKASHTKKKKRSTT